MKKTYTYQTSIAPITISEENGKIIEVEFKPKKFQNQIIEETPLINKTYKQITEYLDGKRKEFDIPISLKGTPFQMKVWNALKTIPYGETRSYQEIAKMINNPKACRAVGMANNRNPVSIIVPCHRVIGKNGTLVGYGGGLQIKEKLLELEKRA